MKNCLLSFAVVVALLAIGAPAYSQYMYLDVDGDTFNSQGQAVGDDQLDALDTGADVYLDLTKNRDNSSVSCTDGTGSVLSLISYEFTLKQSGSGSVAFTGYTNNLAGFTSSGVLNDGTPGSPGFDTAAGEAWVYLIATNPTDWPDPAKLKLGHLTFTVTGTPKIDFVVLGTANINNQAGTTFGSECFQSSGGSVWYLTEDWFDVDGTASPTPVVENTWGKIKNLLK